LKQFDRRQPLTRLVLVETSQGFASSAIRPIGAKDAMRMTNLQKQRQKFPRRHPPIMHNRLPVVDEANGAPTYYDVSILSFHNRINPSNAKSSIHYHCRKSIVAIFSIFKFNGSIIF
jgi:hypothetical protein